MDCRDDQEDDLYTDLVVGRQDEELERDDDILPHPPFDNYCLQGYDRTNGTQSAPPLDRRGGKEGQK